MKFILIIIITFSTLEEEAVKIDELNGNKLFFESEKVCYEHARKNLDSLHYLVEDIFPERSGFITVGS